MSNLSASEPRSPSTLTLKYLLLFGFFILIVLGWTAYWFVAKHTVITELEKLRSEEAVGADPVPWQLSWESLTVGGFPFQLRFTAENVTAYNQASHVSCDVASLAVLAQPWSMKHLLLNWDNGATCHMDARATIQVSAARGRASVVFSADIQRPRVIADIPQVFVTAPFLSTSDPLEAMEAVVSFDPVSSDTIELGLRLTELHNIAVPSIPPVTLSDIQAAARLSRPRPESWTGTALTLHDLSFTYAQARLSTSGALMVDDAGLQTGEMRISTPQFEALKTAITAHNSDLDTPLELAQMMFTDRETGTTEISAKMTNGQVSVAGFDLFSLPPWDAAP